MKPFSKNAPRAQLPANELHHNVGKDLIEWHDRARRAVELVSSLPARTAAPIVADLGCGRQTLRGLLPKTWIYRPYDYCKRTPDTILCDFNNDPLCGDFDIAFCLGVIEYLDKPTAFLAQTAQRSSYVVLSYNGPTTSERRQRQGWKNCLSFSEIEGVWVNSGGRIVSMIEMPENERIYLFERKAHSASPHFHKPADTGANAPLGSSCRPKVLLLADRPGWAYDAAAQAISKDLSGEFEFRIEYVWQKPDLGAWPFDLIHVFFWGETYHQRFVTDPRRVIKEISSHRWANEDQYGRLTPKQMEAKYLTDAGTLTATSLRLQRIFSPLRKVWLAQNGFDPAQFMMKKRSGGRLRIGWAGNAKDPCKGLEDILRPATAPDFELRLAEGGLNSVEMVDFYNSIDVLCVASTAEGEPLTLIEAMACGCFPVTVDVGIVPELVRHGSNGLIVNRTPAAFRAAFQWCAANVERVREAGRQNAETMLRTRAWSQLAQQWREVFRHAHQALTVTNASSNRTTQLTPAPSTFPNRPKSLALFSAAVNGDNSGDALIEDAIRRLLPEHPATTFPLLQPLTDEQIEQVNECDVAIICGTNLYQSSFCCALTPEVIARIRIPIVPLGVGTSALIGRLPEMNAEGARAVRMIHERFTVGSVRDPASLRFVRGLGIRNVELTGCPVLFHAKKEPYFGEGDCSRLVLSVRARLLYVENRWGAKSLKTLEHLCRQFKPTLILQSPYDIAIGERLANEFGVEYLYDGKWGCEVMINAAQMASRTAGFRLHFGMLSLSYGKHAIFIGTDTRTSEFCEMMGLPYHDIHTYEDEIVEGELQQPPPPMELFLEKWRGLCSAMQAVLAGNDLTGQSKEWTKPQVAIAA
jgi:polysaccharide pyruvyl transferase WcaK-like protein